MTRTTAHRVELVTLATDDAGTLTITLPSAAGPLEDEQWAGVPDGATDWERQELNRHYQAACLATERLVTALTRNVARLHDGNVENYRSSLSYPGVDGLAAEATVAQVRLAHVQEGALHRIAMDRLRVERTEREATPSA